VIHTLPAVTDAAAALTGIEFHWLVEEGCSEVPAWHPAVTEVIPVALRRWRRAPIAAWRSGQPRRLRERLRGETYDLVLDAQGLLKSALLTRLAQGPRAGLDRRSAREPLAGACYDRTIAVPKGLHAVERLRRLFAAALGYDRPSSAPDYGIHLPAMAGPDAPPYLLLLHGTTWPSKHWPETYWIELARLARTAGYGVRLPWGSPTERERAERIAAAADGQVLPRLGLTALAHQLAGAAGVVGVDSGLAHLAAALGVPAVTLYGPTRTDLTGAVGAQQRNLAADYPCAPCLRRDCRAADRAPPQPPCFRSLPPVVVWDRLLSQQGLDLRPARPPKPVDHPLPPIVSAP
jgi:heptosyltransferase I